VCLLSPDARSFRGANPVRGGIRHTARTLPGL